MDMFRTPLLPDYIPHAILKNGLSAMGPRARARKKPRQYRPKRPRRFSDFCPPATTAQVESGRTISQKSAIFSPNPRVRNSCTHTTQFANRCLTIHTPSSWARARRLGLLCDNNGLAESDLRRCRCRSGGIGCNPCHNMRLRFCYKPLDNLSCPRQIRNRARDRRLIGIAILVAFVARPQKMDQVDYFSIRSFVPRSL